jgi:hypothetical protein
MKFCEKNVLCEKGDEITRFDGTLKKAQVDPPFMQPYSIAVWSARSVAEAKRELT